MRTRNLGPLPMHENIPSDARHKLQIVRRYFYTHYYIATEFFLVPKTIDFPNLQVLISLLNNFRRMKYFRRCCMSSRTGGWGWVRASVCGATTRCPAPVRHVVGRAKRQTDLTWPSQPPTTTNGISFCRLDITTHSPKQLQMKQGNPHEKFQARFFLNSKIWEKLSVQKHILVVYLDDAFSLLCYKSSKENCYTSFLISIIYIFNKTEKINRKNKINRTYSSPFWEKI